MSGMLPELNVSAHEDPGPEIPAVSMTRSILSLAPELIYIVTDEVRSVPAFTTKPNLPPARHSRS